MDEEDAVLVVISTRVQHFYTYDHRLVRTGHPVRSAILKHQIGRSVVGWVTTSESLLLYVLFVDVSIIFLWSLKSAAV